MDRAKVRIGDALEVSLPNGQLAYIQYCTDRNWAPAYGPLVRVLPGRFRSPPANLANIVAGTEDYVVYVPVRAACSRPEFRVVANCAVPERCRTVPTLKAYNENPLTGERTWFICDAHSSRKVGKLTPEDVDLSLEALWTPLYLIDRLVEEWRPRDEVRPRDLRDTVE